MSNKTLLDSTFGRTLCFDFLNYIVEKSDKKAGDNLMSQEAWYQVLIGHADKEELGIQIAKNIALGIIKAEDIIKEYNKNVK